MEKNSKNFSVQKAKKLAGSEAGKQLMAYLQRENSPELNNAMQLAAKGDYSALQSALSSLMQSKEAQALLKKLEE